MIKKCTVIKNLVPCTILLVLSLAGCNSMNPNNASYPYGWTTAQYGYHVVGYNSYPSYPYYYASYYNYPSFYVSPWAYGSYHTYYPNNAFTSFYHTPYTIYPNYSPYSRFKVYNYPVNKNFVYHYPVVTPYHYVGYKGYSH